MRRHEEDTTRAVLRAAGRNPDTTNRAFIDGVHGVLQLHRFAAKAVVAWWDRLDAVPSDDPRPTEDFVAEMDRRINALRKEIE